MTRYLAAILSLLLPALASAQTANLWIDTSGGTCTRQGTAATYVDAAACSSMQAAIAACTAGDTIRMKAGTYGGQTITTSRTTPGCPIIAEDGTTIGGLSTAANFIDITNIDASSWDFNDTKGIHDITCRDCNFSGNGGLYWATPQSGAANTSFYNINWIGGSLSNFDAGSNACAVCIYAAADVIDGDAYDAHDILIDGITFDSITNSVGPSNHFEIIRIDGVITDFTLSRSKFTNYEVSSSTLFFSTFRGNRPSGVTVENNFFEDNGSNPAINFNFTDNPDTCTNFTIRYNTFKLIPQAGGNCSGGYSNYVWIGNIFERTSGSGHCQGTSYTDNALYGTAGNACDASDLLTSLAALNFDTDGYTLLAGSSAIDAGGTGADCIATDINGNSRPVGARCDAGAHEFGSEAEEGDPVSHRIPWHWLSSIALLLGGGLFWRYGNGKGGPTSHGGGAVAARVSAGARDRGARDSMAH